MYLLLLYFIHRYAVILHIMLIYIYIHIAPCDHVIGFKTQPTQLDKPCKSRLAVLELGDPKTTGIPLIPPPFIRLWITTQYMFKVYLLFFEGKEKQVPKTSP